jgi:Flp pilus assembly pilin Flp
MREPDISGRLARTNLLTGFCLQAVAQTLYMVQHRVISLLSVIQSRTLAARSDDGQALVEYALIILLIATVAVGVLTVLGQNVSTILQQIGDGLPGS